MIAQTTRAALMATATDPARESHDAEAEHEEGQPWRFGDRGCGPVTVRSGCAGSRAKIVAVTPRLLRQSGKTAGKEILQT